ncbi:MAG: putative RNA methyltransferase [Eubacteriales bacterium]
MTNVLNLLVCPVCGAALIRRERSLCCTAGHTFDLAKCGYVNLLPPGKEKNARTGDEREMVRAREAFLSLGCYDRITDRLAELIAAHAAESSLTVCDMGSGEGYHTCRLTGRLAAQTGGEVLAVGFDASKYAAERACKRAVRSGLMPADGVGAAFDAGTAAYFLPGNLFRLPVADHCMNTAVSLFAPVAGAEAKRVLTKNGILAVVSSGAGHLMEMRRLLYDDVHVSGELPAVPDGFSEWSRERLTYSVTLTHTDELLALFTMTPFYYKTTEAGRARLAACPMPFSLTVEVNYSIFGA